ncbi:MAG TPA: methionyl-tRNA formyltransferase [Tepidisphaeraceae bacterium]|nr:methionyl-tRNA formyltransferase [Tepidisphaeraceae bacterium]
MPSLRIIFAGAGEFGLPSLRAIVASEHQIIQVYTQPDRPAGRGMKLSPTPVAHFAQSAQLPLVRSSDINAEQLPAADLLVVIAFGQKISDFVINHPRLQAINLHASILPKYRGAAPINAAIIAGESVAGNSIIRLAQKMDAGAVLGQSSLEIAPLETAGELHDRLAEDGAGLIRRVIDELARGVAVEVEQEHAQATLARKLSRNTSRLDFTLPAEQLGRQIRGMYPWPGCRVRLMASENELGRIVLVRAIQNAAARDASYKPGEIDETGLVCCGTGRLQIVELLPEGKRPMTLEAYKNGHSWQAGMRLESL